MSELCDYCGVVSRNACSDYKREYLREELLSCPNLYDSDRYGALVRAGLDTDTDRAVHDLREENLRLRQELDRRNNG